MEEKVSRRGRHSRQELEARTVRPQPLTGQPEGVQFRLLRPTDERADVQRYWARQSFYAALRLYAPAAFDELSQAAAPVIDSPHVRSAVDVPSPTRFAQFVAGLDEHFHRWCHRYDFLAVGEEEPASARTPDWLSSDLSESFVKWHPKQGPFPLRAFWCARWDPVTDDFQFPEPDPFQDDVEYPRPVRDVNASGRLIAPNPDSAEMHALLRVELVRTEVDAAGAAVPVVLSSAQVKAELVQRIAALIEFELPELLGAAAKLGIQRPSDEMLETIMRRYVLKQFRRLDSVEIAAGETRGDPACLSVATDVQRQDIVADGSRRGAVDASIRQAAHMLGVPARPFLPGRKPKQSYRNIVLRKG